MSISNGGDHSNLPSRGGLQKTKEYIDLSRCTPDLGSGDLRPVSGNIQDKVRNLGDQYRTYYNKILALSLFKGSYTEEHNSALTTENMSKFEYIVLNKKFKLNAIDNNGMTLLAKLIAVKNVRLRREKIDYILDHFGEEIDYNSANTAGMSPLHFAAKLNDTVTLTKLLKKDHIKYKHESDSNRLPIFEAAANAHTDIFAKFFEVYGHDVFHWENSFGENIYDYAKDPEFKGVMDEIMFPSEKTLHDI